MCARDHDEVKMGAWMKRRAGAPDGAVKKKVLVIPSWYPTNRAPLMGCFFREQAALMQCRYDVRVMYGRNRLPREADTITPMGDELLTPPAAISFSYSQSDERTEQENVHAMIESYVRAVRAMIRDGWKPDMIHAHSTVHAGVIAHQLKRQFNIPCMITEHQYFLLHRYSDFLRKRIYEALEAADKVAAVSTDKIRFILMHEIRCDPVFVGNLIDDQLFTMSPGAVPTQGGEYRILTVAGASFIKDLYTFFKAIRELRQLGERRIHATIVGNGVWGEEKYRDYAESIGVLDACTFVDVVEREKMPAYYAACDVFVSTSIAEGFQVSILEALASGKPVISTRHGGAEDVLNADNGILVPIRDYRGIAEAVIRVKQKHGALDGDSIREDVVRKYGRKPFLERISALYEEVCAG